MLASDVIKNQCCGNLLNNPKCELVKKVKILEATIFLQENQLKNATAKIKRLTNEKL